MTIRSKVKGTVRFVRNLANASWHHFRISFLPRKVLRPVELFAKDGWNSKIFNSVSRIGVTRIIVFGGYLGSSTQEWKTRFPDAVIDVFEPVPRFADVLRDRFQSDDVRIHPYGISATDQLRDFSLSGDATFSSDIVRPGISVPLSDSLQVEFRSVTNLERILGPRADIVEINIEGGEYELLTVLHDRGLLKRMKNVFVQFHDVGSETESKLRAANLILESSHKLEWSYRLVWDYWKARG